MGNSILVKKSSSKALRSVGAKNLAREGKDIHGPPLRWSVDVSVLDVIGGQTPIKFLACITLYDIHFFVAFETDVTIVI